MMKRTSAITGMLFLAAIGLAAAVWDGSAVAGGAGDFPDEGFYGACNSFPRDTSVTVTNLENGKTVTVIITRNVDNPGVFIALSPKAAAELGMHAGSASRIRAVALIASQADASLPPTRAGETADPDYNPKVYVEREKAAVAAAAAAPAAVAAEPSSAATPSKTIAPVALASARPALPPSTASAASTASERAEVLAKVGEPQKQSSPPLLSLTEPKPVATAKAATTTAPAVVAKPSTPPATPAATSPALVAKTASPKLPADALPLPEASATFPGSPRPLPYGMSLPSPDVPSIPSTSAPTAHGGYLAQAPEVLGDTKPHPRKAAQPRLVIADPGLPSAASTAAQPKAIAKAQEKASVNALARPARASTMPAKLALAEPVPEFAPDELPEAIVSRVIAPTKVVPTPVLAEVRAPAAIGATKTGPEAIALEKPSYAAAVEAAALADAMPLSPSEAYSSEHPGKAGGEGSIMSELQVPDVPRPSEGLAAERPHGPATGAATADLAEPGISTPASTGKGPTAIADARKGPSEPPYADLIDPGVPTPEGLTAGNPSAVAPGQAVAELAEPNPNKTVAVQPAGPETATAIAAEKPARNDAAGLAELGSPIVPSPTESISPEHPAIAKGGERTVTLEPAAPRPPVSASAATAPATVTPKSGQPATVATIKGPSPAGAAQAPASIPMLKGLAKGSFYVQIGVYGTNDALQSSIAGFKSTSYPLAVEKLSTKSGSAAYRLFVGPLSRDESGVVLIRIRSLGFKDAYVRQGS
jgi:hypothetical protein